jgi:DNA-binding response OmpR family regulator
LRKALIVDDEKLIVKGIKFSLEQDGIEVDAAYDGEEAISLVTNNNYDIVVLDLMLPRINGLEVCRQIREFSKVPIIMVTAKGDDMDKIMGFEHGADDYLTKPFNILELKARIKAVFRRSVVPVDPKSVGRNTIKLRNLELDAASRRVYIKGQEVYLTMKEFDLLELFLKNLEKVYSRNDLLREVWGDSFPGGDRTVDVHIRRLREKIEENPSDPKYLFTKWGVGYYFQ